MRPLRHLVLALLCGAVLAPAARGDDLSDNVFRNQHWRITFESPNGYRRGGVSPYPAVLVRYSHPSGATLSLAAQTLPPSSAEGDLPCGQTPLGRFAADNVAALKKANFQLEKPPRLKDGACRIAVRSRGDKGTRGHVLQAYLVRGNAAYVLTLALPKAAEARSDDLELALERLEIKAPATAPAAAAPGKDLALGSQTFRPALTYPLRYPGVRIWLPGPRPFPSTLEKPAE